MAVTILSQHVSDDDGKGTPAPAEAQPSGAGLHSTGAGGQDSVSSNGLSSGSTGQEFVWPVEGWIVQGMSARHPTGIDIGVGVGAPVHAVRAGRVIFAGGDPCCSYGYFVIVEHDARWASLYAHLSAFRVQLGDEVAQGQLIGLAGATGKANGPHLHFELRSYGAPVDPFDYLPYRADMRPPPVGLVDATGSPAEAGGGAAGAQPSPQPGTSLSPEQAVAIAVGWLSSSGGEAAYTVDASACHGVRMGPNWVVTCDAMLQGCQGSPDCAKILSACVLEQPLLVTETCA